jgi:hypothetical protein
MSGFDSINGGLCRMKDFKSHHGIRDFLDETVILFNQVIQIVNLSIPTKLLKPASTSNILMFSSPA